MRDEFPRNGSRPDVIDDLDILFDFLEALHEIVALPKGGSKLQHISFDQAKGKQLLRVAVNDDLALNETPYRMRENGQIVELDASMLTDLPTCSACY